LGKERYLIGISDLITILFGRSKLQTAASRVLNVFYSEINRKEILNVAFLDILENSVAREQFKE